MTETEQIDKYILDHIAPEGDYLYRLYRATNIHTIHGRMASGHLQGRLLKMLVQMVQPKNVLEVGTFSGYSAICIAEGLPDDGKLYTFEINDEMEDFTRPWIEGCEVADKIDFRIGDANIEAPKLGSLRTRPSNTRYLQVQRLCSKRHSGRKCNTAFARWADNCAEEVRAESVYILK